MGNYILVTSIDQENSVIEGFDKKGATHRIQIVSPWDVFVQYIDEKNELYVEHKDGIINENGVLILNPNILIPVTQVVAAVSCPRKVYIRFLGVDDTPSNAQLQRMTEGNLLHDVFGLRLNQPDLGTSEMVEMVMEQSRTKIISMALDEDNLKEYLNRNAVVFERLAVTDGVSEIDCQHWQKGIHGKFDGIVKSNLLELKTSKIRDGVPWPDHSIQIGIYQKILEERAQYKGKIIYVRDGRMVIKSATELQANDWLIARNYAYLAFSSKIIPQILRGNEAMICDRCFVRDGCHALCAGLNTQRDCQRCTHQGTCSKKMWPIPLLKYYTGFTSAIIEEEREEMRSQHILSRVGIKSNNQSETLINRGYALRVDKKLDEEFINGKYHTCFSHKTEINRFRRGDFVRLYDQSDLNDTSTVYITAVIKEINSLKVNLVSTNPIADDVIMVSSDSSSNLRAARRAVYMSTISSSPIISAIKFPATTTTVGIKSDGELKNPLMDYNNNQILGILGACSTPDYYLIQGPAGTGKTSVIIEIINQLFNQGKRIIVAAYTNMAVDNVAIKLKYHSLPFVRLGNPHSINEELSDYTLDSRMDDYLMALEESLPIILVTTTSTIARNEYADIMFDYVILDEGAQMTEPESMKAVLHGERSILVGDHKQLQPIVKSHIARKKGLQISLFERLAKSSVGRFTLLTDQYRMSDDILEFPNFRFYDGKLRSADDSIGSQEEQVNDGLVRRGSYQVIAIHDKSVSSNLQVNNAEAAVVLNLVSTILDGGDINPHEIGIITPFRAQVARLREMMPGIAIDTIDRYQGSERRIIIFSTISTANIPILADPRRMNVALTRARSKLIVVLSNPVRDGGSIVNQLYVDADKRGVATDLSSDELQSYLMDETISQSLTIISKRTDSERGSAVPTTYTPVEVKFVGIYYDTMLLVEVRVESEEPCAICYLPIEVGVECVGCGYWYHTDHLLIWVKKSGFCPVCRHGLAIQKY